ncbi:sensor histidine kinase [Tamaricihabitans halophyticus]|nr:sensor histidine kinase [Tamaricihabitans halophyticus]
MSAATGQPVWPRATSSVPGFPGEPWASRFMFSCAYVLLAISASVSLLAGTFTEEQRLTIVALIGAAAFGELLSFTLPPAWWRESMLGSLLSFAVLCTTSALLILQDPIFLLFGITGFFRALMLRPPAVMFLGLTATAVVVHTFPVGGPVVALTDKPALYLVILTVQVVSVGLGALASQYVHDQNEERRRTVKELEAALEENAGLHAQLVTQAREAGVLDERQRMAREIHDTLAQSFTGIVTQLEAADRPHTETSQWRAHVDRARILAREGLAEARRSVQALRPESLERHALPVALAELSERWARDATAELSFETTGESKPMLAEIELALYRVAQEALTNVSKHAKAGKVGITLSYMDDVVLLDVRDDGTGFQHRAHTGGEQGFGLNTMRQRLQRVAGNLEVESRPGEGTAISASVPAILAEAR